MVAAMMLAATPARRAAAELLAVPEAVRQLHAPKEETDVLRAPDGTRIGEQRYVVAVAGPELTFEVHTRFTRGDESDERGEMELGDDGIRARRFDKTLRRDAQVVQEQ